MQTAKLMTMCKQTADWQNSCNNRIYEVYYVIDIYAGIFSLFFLNKSEYKLHLYVDI